MNLFDMTMTSVVERLPDIVVDIFVLYRTTTVIT